jgi:glyoxylase-like metal-dependent hydrolase (beta-lactamase superfamily II)
MHAPSWSLALAVLLVATPALAGAPPGLTVETHTAPEAGFLVSSHVVVVGNEVLLVDSQMLREQAEQLIALARKHEGKKVKAVFVTNAHPENYLGLQYLKDAFPDAQLLAPPEVAQDIRDEGERTLKYYRETYSAGAMAPRLAEAVPEVKPHTARTLRVDGVDLEVLSFSQREGKGLYALYHRASGTLLAGDLLYSQAHLSLVDQPPRPWIATLEKLQALKLTRVYPGHGPPAGPELVQHNLEYLRHFQDVITTTYSAGGVVQRVRMKYPDLGGMPALQMSAARFYPPVGPPDAASAPASTPDAAKAR